MNTDIMVSIMITTYNLAEYVDQTIQSVMEQQTDFAYEVLVGDDGSEDGTIEAVQKWMQKYPEQIRMYVMDREPGKSYNRIERASRNRLNLLQHAKGKYFMFLDGDDFYVDRRKIQKQVDILEQLEYADCIVCTHNMWYYWNDNKKKQINRSQKRQMIPARQYWRRGTYLCSDSALFRNICNCEEIKEKLETWFDDNLIMFYMLQYGDIVYLPDIMACYRQREGSVWNTTTLLEQNIVNLLDIDVEKSINGSMEKEIIRRHLYNMFFLWTHSGRSTYEIRRKYVEQIDHKKYPDSLQWLQYGEAPAIVKMRMSWWIFWRLVAFVPTFVWRMLFQI